MAAKLWLTCGALLAGLGVAADAVAAHCFKGWAAELVQDFHTAAHYQILHGIALMLVGFAAVGGRSRSLIVAGIAMLLGILLFSGGIYLRVLIDNQSVSAVIPYGGGSFMVGWLALAWSVCCCPDCNVCGRK